MGASEAKDKKFDLIEQAEKRMKNFETVIQIPDEAKLLRANTMLLELYVVIVDSQFSVLSGRQKENRINKYDFVYETANQMRVFFEDIQFKRGLAILDYVQARRLFRMNRKAADFKGQIQEAVEKFSETYEVEGIEQCINESKRILKVSDQDLMRQADSNIDERVLSIQDVQNQRH